MRAAGLIDADGIGFVLRALDFCMGRGEAEKLAKPLLRVIQGGKAAG